MTEETTMQEQLTAATPAPICELQGGQIPVGHGIAHGEWNIQYVGPDVPAELEEDPTMLGDLQTRGLSPTSDHPHYVTCYNCQAYRAKADKQHPLVHGYILVQPGGELVIESFNHGLARIAATGLWAIRAQRDGELQSHGVMLRNVD